MTEEGEVDAGSPGREASVTSEPDLSEEHEDGDEENGTAEAVVAKSGESVTNAQYKALKAITDTLTNFKSTRKGDEYELRSTTPYLMESDLGQEPLAIVTLQARAKQETAARLL
jgi:hypothetical protein